MNKNLELDYEIIVGKVNSETIIKFLDLFSNDLKKITVVVLDQASIHTSDSIINKLKEWVDGGQPSFTDKFW